MNWGKKIVLGMVAFMLFIVGMVIYMFSIHGRDALIENDYYEKGIHYDQEYEAEQNLLNDQATPVINVRAQQLVIKLKDSASYTLTLMKPADATADRKLEGHTVGTEHLVLANCKGMSAGRWFLKLEWQSAGKNYLYKTNINL